MLDSNFRSDCFPGHILIMIWTEAVLRFKGKVQNSCRWNLNSYMLTLWDSGSLDCDLRSVKKEGGALRMLASIKLQLVRIENIKINIVNVVIFESNPS